MRQRARRSAQPLAVIIRMLAQVTEDLWAEVHRAFHLFPDRTEAIAEADRIFRKDSKTFPIGFISESTCAVRREWLGLAELGELKRRHEEDMPLREGGPIVAVEHNGEKHVVDGTKRTNRRLKHRLPGPHEALIIARFIL